MSTGVDDTSKQWHDILHGKHECFPISGLELRECRLGDEQIVYRITKYLPKFQSSTGAIRGDLLFLSGSTDEMHGELPCGAMLIGRRAEDGIYNVHVWHELYPWACKYLGIQTPPPSPSE